ncbi:cytosine permease [Klebsiella pneumoniae]|uniref:cytosine permease n=1 Tax=Klebsiella pneumoniae TaxID=573 RepID=UPI003F7D5F5E
MMDYQTAVRGAFFDIAGVAETPDEVAAQARYLDDGLLFLQEGKIIALLPWQEGEAFLHPLKGYVDLREPQKISFRTGGMIAAVGSILLTPWNLFNSPELIHYTLDVLGAFIGPLFGILIADFYLIKRGRVSVDDLFDDTPQGKYWYRNGFNPKAIAALLPSVGLGLIISFIPALHEVANFSWFIGVFLGATAYRWLARDEREVQAKAAFRSGAVAQKE